MPFPSHNTVQCIAIHSPALLAAPVTIQNLYRDTLPSPTHCLFCHNTLNTVPAIQALLIHNTLTVLNYNSNNLATCNIPHIAIQNLANLHFHGHYVTIQFLLSQYNWAVAQFSPCTNFFFFCFSLYFFSHNINFQLLENTKKNIYLFFFLIFQNTQINL